MTTTRSQSERSWLADYERRVTETIRLHGCMIQGVMGEGRTPPFAYTVGLFELGHPELIVYGLDVESSGGMLNWFAAQIRDGEVFSPGQVIQPPESGTRLLVQTFHDPWLLYTANRHYRRGREAPVRALQLIWDAGGAFPWEVGYPEPEWLQPWQPVSKRRRIRTDVPRDPGDLDPSKGSGRARLDQRWWGEADGPRLT